MSELELKREKKTRPFFRINKELRSMYRYYKMISSIENLIQVHENRQTKDLNTLLKVARYITKERTKTIYRTKTEIFLI